MTQEHIVNLDKAIELYKSKVAFYESQNTRGEYKVTVRELKYVIEILEALRIESPQGEWIPVSERLPQNRDWYLGIFREVDTGWINPIPYICDYVGKETIGTTKAGWILKNITDENYCAEYYKNLECICWQPLPVKPNIPDLGGGEEE